MTTDNEEVWQKHISEINPVSGDCSLVDDAVMLWADEKIKQLAAALAKNAELEQQIKVYREALEIKCLYFGQTENDRKALAQPFDTSALERYRKEVLSQSLEYERGYTEGLKIGQELRRMASQKE